MHHGWSNMQQHAGNRQNDPTRRSLRGRAAGWRMTVLALLLGTLFWIARGSSSRNGLVPSGSVPSSAAVESPATGPSSADDRLRALAVGTWQDEYRGKRTLELRADGSGRMVVELSGWTATLFADRLEFDLVWSVEGGRMRKQTIGGRPEERVRMILDMMGDRVDEPILELTADRLLLLDADGKTRYDWRRAPKSGS